MPLDFVGRTALKRIAGVATAIAMMGLGSTAGAATLSTGQGALGASEPNWTLSASPGSTSLTIVSGAQDYPNVWVVAPAGSNWITPYAGGGTTATSEAPLGEYDYSLVFGNPGGPVTVQWSSDNGAVFYLNGVAQDIDTDTSYSALSTFVIPAADFLSSNTFLVAVQNVACDGCNNPTGLLVSASATPLPGALPLFAGGLGVVGLLARRRRRKATLSA